MCKRRKVESRGMKAATTRIQQENLMLSPTNPKKKIQADIVREVNEAFGSNVNAKTVARMVKEGRIGVSPLKRGPMGNFSQKSLEHNEECIRILRQIRVGKQHKAIIVKGSLQEGECPCE
jgi:hypothetical protein